MPRLAWATDIHLEFCSTLRIEEFASEVRATSPDALLLAGDTATAPSLATALTLLERLLPCPIWFVLGNHDFYEGILAAVRAEIADLMAALGVRSRFAAGVRVRGLDEGR